MPEQEPQGRVLGEDRDLDPREPAQVMAPGGEKQPASQILRDAVGTTGTASAAGSGRLSSTSNAFGRRFSSTYAARICSSRGRLLSAHRKRESVASRANPSASGPVASIQKMPSGKSSL